MKTKQLLGVTGSIIILLGVFAPLASVSIIGEMNYVQNNKGDGTIVLLLGIGSLALALVKKFQWLWFTGVGCLAILLFTAISTNARKSSANVVLETDVLGDSSRVDEITLSRFVSGLEKIISNPASGFLNLEPKDYGAAVNYYISEFAKDNNISDKNINALNDSAQKTFRKFKSDSKIPRTILRSKEFTKVYGDLPQLLESDKIDNRIARILAWKATAMERATRYSPAESDDFKIQLDGVANRLIREEVYRGKITGVSLVDMAIQSVQLFGSYLVQWLVLIAGASLVLASAVIREKRVQSCTDEQVLPSETA